MNILVFGAGVLGSYLAHALVRGRNDVTVLARGKRAEDLRRDGLVIRHYFQRKTTVDQVKVIHELRADERYDLIFVVMKYNDFPSVLSILAENVSSNIVLVGNNVDARGMQTYIEQHSPVKKHVIFGFQLSGGLREAGGRVVCIRGGGQMVLDALDGDIPFKPMLERAFRHSKYKLTYLEDIDSWLKSHVVLVAAMNSAGYLHNNDFLKVSKDKKLLMQALSAMDEGFQVLEKLGFAVIPAGQVRAIRQHRQLVYYGFKILHRMPFMKSMEGFFGEIMAIYESFESLKRASGIATPNWDELEKRSTLKFAGER
ncbi:2-dehydropantoate 2-reductase [Paenibacillus swuensis]|uniref:2-dehydropantoate 2-reductase n=1 Tax=Paenibacillus swuensis TaxID=1178515 RepID=A0A172TDV6_9BACL|nr:2-dehydropantoate 2-reductase N-terminal domain-containing protein [Paenibacillus swuensis]ANE45208.1 2-dehydropantoate 2-reductase [Paenibacillus swuensis]